MTVTEIVDDAFVHHRRRYPRDPPPLTLSVRLGDALDVTDTDSAIHICAFLVVPPAETGRSVFCNRGVFSGRCTASDHGQIMITVE